MKMIVGSGRLASMLITVMRENNQTYLFGRNLETVNKLVQQFPFIKKGSENEFISVEHVFLCLPPAAYKPFFNVYHNHFSDDVTFYHMATALEEQEVKSLVGEKKVIPLKLAGHAAVVKKERNGLFVIPNHYEDEIEKVVQWFPKMDVICGSEKDVLLANQLGTEAAIKMVIELTEALEKHQIPQKMAKQTLNQTVQGIITAYQKHDLGGFAKRIMEQVKQKGE
jgi:pyrroline-5-carboxylate reductase